MKRLLLAAILLCGAARGQEDPTPFWLPPPDGKPAKDPVRPGKKKPARAHAPGAQTQKETPPPRAPATRTQTLQTPPPAPGTPTSGTRAVDPSAQPRGAPSAVVAPPPEAGAPVAPAVEPAAESGAPTKGVQAPDAAGAPPPPGLAPPSSSGLPPPAGQEQPEQTQAEAPRRWSLDAAFGVWGKPRSDGLGRDWQLAYGLRVGRALWQQLELELELLRAGGSAGSPLVSASATHNLVALRAFWVVGDTAALLLGGGGGAALSQTHDSLLPSTDPNAVASGLDAFAVEGVVEVTGAFRVRISGGLEARAEVSAAERKGKLEILPLLTAGAAF